LITQRDRKSKFVRLFDKTPPGVVCPHFYELILSNGCPYNCSYCYLKLTFRGKTEPVLFQNGWECVKTEIDSVNRGVFSTGELADSLAVIPPLLAKAIDYFEVQTDKTLLLVTKSINIETLLNRKPIKNVILSFSINSIPAAGQFESSAPSPVKRLEAARKMLDLGWRVRIRLDPVILEVGLDSYEFICNQIALIKPEMVTVGSLRQYPGLFRFLPHAPRIGLKKANDGRMRYLEAERVDVYRHIASWLDFQPSLCKETKDIWDVLGWQFLGCNCTS
jgi:spore photoproduct lyase